MPRQNKPPPRDAVEWADTFLNSSRSSWAGNDAKKKNQVAQQHYKSGNNTIIHVMMRMLARRDPPVVGEDALSQIDRVLGLAPEKITQRQQGEYVSPTNIEMYDAAIDEFYDEREAAAEARDAPSPPPKDKKKPKRKVDNSDSEDEPFVARRKRFKGNYDEGGNSDSDSGSEFEPEEEKEDGVLHFDLENPTGTGNINAIPDSVLNDRSIFPRVPSSMHNIYDDDDDDDADRGSKKPAVPVPISILKPDDYIVYKLSTPFPNMRSPYTNKELAGQDDVDVTGPRDKFLGSGTGNKDRTGKISSGYHSLKEQEIKQRQRRGYMNVHKHTVAELLPAAKGDLLPFLLTLTGFTIEQVRMKWHVDKSSNKHFIRQAALDSVNLRLFEKETHARDVSSNKRKPSPTLMCLLKEYIHNTESPVREETPKLALNFLCMREIVMTLLEVKQIMQNSGVVGDDKSNAEIRERITMIQNLGYTVSFLHEVTGDNTTGWNDVIDAVFSPRDDKEMRDALRSRYGSFDPNDEGKSVIGLYITMSQDKSNTKKRAHYQHELNQNKNPVIYNVAMMHKFKKFLMGEMIKGDKHAWKAAALLVEMHVGSRITEVLGFADYFQFDRFSVDEQESIVKAIKDDHPDMNVSAMQRSIVQVGVLKRKNNKQIFVRKRMLPKPVIMGLNVDDINKAVYVVRTHVSAWMKKNHSNVFNPPDTMLNTLPPSYFTPLVSEVNDYLKKHITKGVIQNYRNGIPAPATTHTLRRFYAGYSYDKHSGAVLQNVWINIVLGHGDKSLAASLAYTNYNTEGTPLEIRDEPISSQVLNLINILREDVRENMEFKDRYLELRDRMAFTGPPVVKRERKRERAAPDGERVVVAVCVDPDPTIIHNLPERDESRVSGDDIGAERERAAIMNEYVSDNFRVRVGDTEYVVKPTSTNLRKCPFGAGYYDAFAKHHKQTIDDLELAYTKFMDNLFV